MFDDDDLVVERKDLVGFDLDLILVDEDLDEEDVDVDVEFDLEILVVKLRLNRPSEGLNVVSDPPLNEDPRPCPSPFASHLRFHLFVFHEKVVLDDDDEEEKRSSCWGREILQPGQTVKEMKKMMKGTGQT